MTLETRPVLNHMLLTRTVGAPERPESDLSFVVENVLLRAVNKELYSVASFEDYSLNWSDYSFEFLAED